MRSATAMAAALVSTAALLAVPSAPATASPPRSAALSAQVSRLASELGLVEEVGPPLGLPRRGALAQLELENGDGYEIGVVAFGQTVMLGVRRGEGNRAMTIYLAHGRVTPTSIRASFGERGRIALRFRPSGRVLRLPNMRGCRGRRRAFARFGVFVGALRFDGEGGFTSVRARRVSGSSFDLDALIACLRGVGVGRGQRSAADLTAVRHAPVPGVPTHPSPGPKPTTLLADRKLPLSRTLFLARARGSRPPVFVAAEEGSEGGLGIVRFAFARGPRASFAFDDALSLGGVTPPPPFSGSATFVHGPGPARSWAGTLAVSFLGEPGVALAGQQFDAQLIRGW